MGRTEQPPSSSCTNCGAELIGSFCHACGQSASDPAASLRVFVSESLGDVAHLRSGLVFSLISLFNPGFLTREYLLGRRVRYVGPLQLYFLAAAVFFLVSSVRPVVQFDPDTRWARTTLGAIQVGEQLGRESVDSLAAEGITMPLFEERFANHVNSMLPSFLILSVVLFALALALIYIRHGRMLVEHAIFALHWSAFYLLVMAIYRLLPEGGIAQSVGQSLAVLGAFVYLFIALKRVFRQSALLTALKAIMVFVVFNAFLAAWVLGVISLAFARA